MTLQVKILLSYLALGGGAGGIYLGANGGFGNSAMEGVVEISEPDSNPQLVVVKPPVEEPQTPVEKPQNVEAEKEIPVNDEAIPEIKASEKEEEVLANDGKTEQTEASNNNKDAEPKPVLELQVAKEAIVPRPQELRIDMASPTPPRETKASKGSDSIKGQVSEQPTTKTEQKIGKSALNPKETQCPDQSSQKGGGAFFEDMSPFSTGQYGIDWIKCYAQHIQSRNNN